ncbi:MAG: galactokinase [Kiritimatiellaeota bacterium]|nr:galactokinase [Kiritimatiellota bacterium]
MTNKPIYDELQGKFRAHFGRYPEVVAYAPGRIEVLGNHTDYNEGFVFSAAIQFGTFFAVAKSVSMGCRLVAGDLMREVTFSADDVKPPPFGYPLSKGGSDTWQNYVKGTFAGLAERKPPAHGFDGMFLGNVPLGSGLSSSAALEMSTGIALAKLYNIATDAVMLAKIGQNAEHTFVGCKCGLLDQISSLAGQENRLVKTDFRSVSYETVNMGAEACFLLCDTRTKHALADGAYNRLRESCEQAAAHFARVLRHPVNAIRDVSMTEWAIYKRGLPEDVANHAAHPIGENERVLKGAKLLSEGNLAGFGAVMFDSHESSRVLFGNSCAELDAVVDAAKKIPGVLGARLSGGGFGGSAVVLVHSRDVETASAALASAYAATFNTPCDVSVIKPAAGAYLV